MRKFIFKKKLWLENILNKPSGKMSFDEGTLKIAVLPF